MVRCHHVNCQGTIATGYLSIVTVVVLFALVRDERAGLWCNGVACSESACIVDELFDSDTAASVGTGAFCIWKDDSTVLVTFGRGESSINPVKPHYFSLRQVPADATAFGVPVV